MVRALALYVAAFLMLGGLDLASSYAAVGAGGREANALATDEVGAFSLRNALIVNVIGLVATTSLLAWSLNNRAHIPCTHLTQPANAIADWLNPGVVLAPFLVRYRGRAAFQYMVVLIAFLVFRGVVVVNNLMIAAGLTGPARWLAGALGPETPVVAAIVLFALAVMIPAGMVATYMLADRMQRAWAVGWCGSQIVSIAPWRHCGKTTPDLALGGGHALVDSGVAALRAFGLRAGTIVCR